jgi:hypothetical protein
LRNIASGIDGNPPFPLKMVTIAKSSLTSYLTGRVDKMMRRAIPVKIKEKMKELSFMMFWRRPHLASW